MLSFPCPGGQDPACRAALLWALAMPAIGRRGTGPGLVARRIERPPPRFAGKAVCPDLGGSQVGWAEILRPSSRERLRPPRGNLDVKLEPTRPTTDTRYTPLRPEPPAARSGHAPARPKLEDCTPSELIPSRDAIQSRDA